jgi:hypothetical protein
MPSYLQYNTSALLYEWLHERAAQQFPRCFQNFDAGAIQLFFLLHALARLMSE